MQRKFIFDDPAEGETASHPMDMWLKQQLGDLHADMLTEELPGELGDLVSRLEARLNGQPAAEDRKTVPARPAPRTVAVEETASTKDGDSEG